jgi:hypothetical protein
MTTAITAAQPAAAAIIAKRIRVDTIGELEELFPVTRSTIYRAVQRASAPKPARAHRQ